MRRFAIIAMIIILLIPIGIAGCGGEDRENLWVDTQGEEYLDQNNSNGFVPTFIRENEKSLDKLAVMMLAYDFDYSIRLNEEGIDTRISNKTASEEEKNWMGQEIGDNDKLVSYASTLLEFQYIESLYRGSSDGDGVLVNFEPVYYDDGSDARAARYISEEALNNHPRKEEYLKSNHVVGNWFYMVEARGDSHPIILGVIAKNALKEDDLAEKEYIVCSFGEGGEYRLLQDENGTETDQHCVIIGVDLQDELSDGFLAKGNSFVFYPVGKKRYFDADMGQDVTEYTVDGWDVLYPVKHGDHSQLSNDYIYESELADPRESGLAGGE